MTYKEHFVALLWVVIAIVMSSCTSIPPERDSVTDQEIIERDGAEEWDLVILGDSDLWLSYEYYAPMFEEDLGIDIVVHNEIKPGTLFPTAALRENQRLQDLISEAEIIVFNVPFVFPDVGGACFNQSLSLEKDGCFGVTQEEYAAAKEIESDVQALWAGKQSTRRIQKDNPYWGQRTPMIYKYR